ncbi:MAG: epoxide hydrolase N-terminal domain-containing protein [Candidatus Azotimanducaceae bacterium WSBS_2022_MAG_OTU7]
MGGDDWRYGVPQSRLKEMVEYWVEEWGWHKQATEINRWNHYETTIDGINLHYRTHRPGTPRHWQSF